MEGLILFLSVTVHSVVVFTVRANAQIKCLPPVAHFKNEEYTCVSLFPVGYRTLFDVVFTVRANA